jgi:putative DNA primase/helicase
VEHLDHSHNIDMQQVWAQVHNLWITGASHYLDADEMGQLNGHNEEFTASDPIEEIILSKLDWEIKKDYWKYMSATEVLNICGHERPTKGDVNTAAAIIRKLNGNTSKRTGSAKLLLVPPEKFN